MPDYSGYYRGDYLAICDRCGFKYHRSQMRLDWEHFLVCRSCYEIRHPQDIVPPSRVDRQWVEEPRPREAVNNFSGWSVVDPNDTVTKSGDEFDAHFAVDGAWNNTDQVLATADYGADYFDGDFELRCLLNIGNDADDDLYNFFGVAQTVEGMDTLNASGRGLGMVFYRLAGAIVVQLVEYDSGTAYQNSLANLSLAVNTTYGFKFKRQGNSLAVEIYDRFFRNLIYQASFAMQGDTGQAYRYLHSINGTLANSGNQRFDLQYNFVELRQ